MEEDTPQIIIRQIDTTHSFHPINNNQTNNKRSLPLIWIHLIRQMTCLVCFHHLDIKEDMEDIVLREIIEMDWVKKDN